MDCFYCFCFVVFSEPRSRFGDKMALLSSNLSHKTGVGFYPVLYRCIILLYLQRAKIKRQNSVLSLVQKKLTSARLFADSSSCTPRTLYEYMLLLLLLLFMLCCVLLRYCVRGRTPLFLLRRPHLDCSHLHVNRLQHMYTHAPCGYWTDLGFFWPYL